MRGKRWREHEGERDRENLRGKRKNWKTTKGKKGEKKIKNMNTVEKHFCFEIF